MALQKLHSRQNHFMALTRMSVCVGGGMLFPFTVKKAGFVATAVTTAGDCSSVSPLSQWQNNGSRSQAHIPRQIFLSAVLSASFILFLPLGPVPLCVCVCVCIHLCLNQKPMWNPQVQLHDLHPAFSMTQGYKLHPQQPTLHPASLFHICFYLRAQSTSDALMDPSMGLQWGQQPQPICVSQTQCASLWLPPLRSCPWANMILFIRHIRDDEFRLGIKRLQFHCRCFPLHTVYLSVLPRDTD